MAKKSAPRARRRPPARLTPTRLQELRLSRGVPKKWLDDFLEKAGVRDALAALDAADKSRGKWLLDAVVRSCHLASKFASRKDLARVRRARDAGFLEGIDAQRKAIKSLRRFIGRYPNETGLAFGGALLAWKERHEGKASLPYVEGTKLAVEIVLDELLEHYSQALGVGIREKANMLHRYQVGPLLYPTPLDQQRAQPDARKNGLIFELAFYNRHATAGHDRAFVEGMPMPREGRPLLSHVATLAQAVLGGKISEGDVTQRVRRLEKQGVGLANWPR